MSDGNTEGTPLSGDSVETTRQHLLQTTKAYLLGALHDATERKSFVEDEDIVHALRKTGKNMNKVSVLEGADGSPPFKESEHGPDLIGVFTP